jgi:hypothetical protein
MQLSNFRSEEHWEYRDEIIRQRNIYLIKNSKYANMQICISVTVDRSVIELNMLTNLLTPEL